MDSKEFRNLQEAYMEVVMNDLDEGAAGDVAARAQKLANQRKGQTPERKATYQGLADKAAQRERGPYQKGDTRTGMSQKERDSRREADAYHDGVHGDGNSTYGKGGITKNPRKLAQQKTRGQHKEEFELWVNSLVEEGHDLSDYTWDEMLDIYESEEWRQDIMEISDRKVNAVGRRRQANVDKAMSSNEYISDKPGATQKLATAISKKNRFNYLNKKREKTGGSQQDAGKGWYHAKEEYVDEAITSEKGKAKAAEMIAKRTTASGRAKSGQGANVATIKHIRRSNRDGLGGTPPNRKVAGSNWPKSYTGIGGSGNKAARRAGTYKEESEIFDAVLEYLVAEGYAETNKSAIAIMSNMSEEWRQSILNKLFE
jgi:hypothetical protein